MKAWLVRLLVATVLVVTLISSSASAHPTFRSPICYCPNGYLPVGTRCKRYTIVRSNGLPRPRRSPPYDEQIEFEQSDSEPSEYLQF